MVATKIKETIFGVGGRMTQNNYLFLCLFSQLGRGMIIFGCNTVAEIAVFGKEASFILRQLYSCKNACSK